MGNIQNLRRYVGHQPIVAIGATTLVTNEDDGESLALAYYPLKALPEMEPHVAALIDYLLKRGV